MKNLWLDDERKKPEGFDLHARSAEEAIELLKNGNITHISFDHDLGEGKSGYDVACWIEEQAFLGTLPRLTWKIHTANPPGRDYIFWAMRQAEKWWKQLEGPVSL